MVRFASIPRRFRHESMEFSDSGWTEVDVSKLALLKGFFGTHLRVHPADTFALEAALKPAVVEAEPAPTTTDDKPRRK